MEVFIFIFIIADIIIVFHPYNHTIINVIGHWPYMSYIRGYLNELANNENSSAIYGFRGSKEVGVFTIVSNSYVNFLISLTS